MDKRRAILIVLDSLGVGELPDADRFGDQGADTFGHISEKMGDDFKIPNLKKLGIGNIDALGVLETYDVAAMIVAADIAAKTAIVELMELRLAKGMCGKSYMTITGSVSAVQAAIDAAKQSAGDKGMFLDESVIARPSEQLMRFLN